MAKKPTAGLPDVFAKPGNAPARGTPLEDLPESAEQLVAQAATAIDPPATQPAASSHAVTAPIAAEPVAAAAPVAPEPVVAKPAAAAPAAATPIVATPVEPPRMSPPPSMDHTPTNHPTTPAAERIGDHRNTPLFGDAAQTVAWIAVAIALSAPLWEGTVLWSIGIRTPAVRAADHDAAALAQQDAKLVAVEQRLAATTTQLDAMRTALATATQRATEATAEVRTLAMLRLGDALRGSNPFATELGLLRAPGSDTGGLAPALARLEPYAATGVPTLGQLQQDLLGLYKKMTRATDQATQGSWMGLISWTGLGGTQAAPRTNPTISAAWASVTRLAAADLAGAIEQASQVGGTFQSAFTDWVADAKARLAADQVLRQIDRLTSKTAAPAR